MEAPFTICSKEQAERYLLNQMNNEAETMFQEHLRYCTTCRTYVDSIRAMSRMMEDDEADSIIDSFESRISNRLFFRSWMAIAAGIIFILGFSFYFTHFTYPLEHHSEVAKRPVIEMLQHQDSTSAMVLQPDNIKPVDKKVSFKKAGEIHQIKTAKRTTASSGNINIIEEDSIQILYPDKFVAVIDVNKNETPFAFKWNREAAFELTMKAEGQVIIHTKGTAVAYTPDRKKMGAYKRLDWELVIQGQTFTGRIFIVQ